MRTHSCPGRVTAALVVLALTAATAGRTAGQAPGPGSPGPAAAVRGVLSLDDALRLTREHHPALRAAAASADAARARTRDAGRYPNPSLTLGVENVGGRLGTDRAETSFMFEQPFERGGDRAARAGLANAQSTLARAHRDLLGMSLEGETVARFCEVWALQERVRRLGDSERIAERSVTAAEERLNAGAAPSFERTRAEGFLAMRRIERARAEAELETERELLALQWGAESAGFDSLALPDAPPAATPALEDLLARLDAHPGLRRAAAERVTESWRVREARAARVSDVQLGLGVRHLAEAGGAGLLVGISMPLPLWNAARGTVAAAESEFSAAAERERQTALEARGQVRAAHRRYLSAVAGWEGVRDRVRPAVEEAARLIAAGYRVGRLGYLDVQESQRSLLEADLLLIDGYAEVWRSRYTLERLMGLAPDAPAPAKEQR